MSHETLALPVSDDLLDAIAERVAERLARRDPQPTGYVGVEEAARFLDCPKSRIYALVSARRIPHHKDGSRTLFDRDELHDWVRRGGATRP